MPLTTTRREAKLSVRLTNEQREMLAQAAALEAGEISRFVAESALERAARVVEEYGVSRLNEENRRRFYEILLNPPAPSEALLKLAEQHVPDDFEV